MIQPNKSSKVSRLRDFEKWTSTTMPAAFNINTTHLKLLTMALWWEPHDPRITTPPTFHGWYAIKPKQSTNLRSNFSTPIFSLPCWYKLWLTAKSVTHPYQHKYWNILLLNFHSHSPHIKFPKINSFLSIQLRTFSSQFHRHSYIHQYNCLNLLFFVCKYNC